MGGEINKPKRYKMIMEMNNEKWYIRSDSIWFYKWKTSQEIQYVLLLSDQYSKSFFEDEDLENTDNDYNVGISCITKDNENYYTIDAIPQNIYFINIHDLSEELYTILECKNENVSLYDAEKELSELEYERLSDCFEAFIIDLLEPDEDDEIDDEIYNRCYSNFTSILTDHCKWANQEEIEHILEYIALYWYETEQAKKLVNIFADYWKWFDYIMNIDTKNELIDWYIDSDIRALIDEILVEYYNIFINPEKWNNKVPEEKTQDGNIQKSAWSVWESLQKLQDELNKAIANEDYERAWELQKEINKFGKGNK
jgi:UvrB/uvrC motif